MKIKNRLILFTIALFAAVLLAVLGHPFIAAFMLLLTGSLLYPTPRARLNANPTLSVPELLQDVLQAFRLETPMLFGPDGFGTDFSSQTAVLNDKITAHFSLSITTSS